MKDFATDPNYLEGTINGRPIAGYHFVQYGETQEYLESLNKAGVVLVYREDNPPEEGKLTLTKPNPEPAPGTITISPVANPGEIVVTDTTDTTVTDTTEIDALPKGLVDLNKEYIAARDELIAKTGKEPNSAEVFSYMVEQAKSGKYQTETTVVTSDIPADVAAEIDALPKGLVDLNKEYIAARDELIAKTGKEPNSSEVFSYMVEQAKSGKYQTETTVSADTTVTDTADNIYADPGLCGPQPQIITIDPEYAKQMEDQFKNAKFRLVGFGEGPVHFHLFYDSEESDTPSRFELVRIGDSDWTNEQVASFAASMIEKSSWDEQQKALMREAVDEFRANPKMAQSYYEYQRSLTIISTMDAETEAVTSVQVASAEDDGWRTIGTLNNPDGIDWKYQAGNLTGSGTASVVWHAQELGALGVWTDGTDNWTAVDGWFDANWTMLGCGDFDGDGKDSVLMSLNGGLFYSVDLDGTLSSLGDLNWSGWEIRAIGDFYGDGRDDLVLFHNDTGSMVMCADGNLDSYVSIGQLAKGDWFVVGAGDYDGDAKDDLLVRQYSSGMLGYYVSGDTSQWVEMGRGVDMKWTVIA